MKRKLMLTIALSLLAFAELSAQNAPRHNPFTGRRACDPVTQRILQHQKPAPVARGTGIIDRLVGWRLDYGFGDIDSAHFKYNDNSRGSVLDNNVLSTYLERGYNPNNAPHQPYPTAVSRNEPASKYDTAYFQSIWQDTLQNKTFVGRSYTGNILNKEYSRSFDYYYGGATYTTALRSDFSYDGSGNIRSDLFNSDTSTALSGTYVPQALYLYSYSAGRVVKDSSLNFNLGTVDPNEVVNYTYDASGSLIMAIRKINVGSGLEINNREQYTYANNKLHTHLSQYTDDNGITWQNSVVDTFNYQGNNLVYSANYSWDDNSSTWTDGYVTKSYYNAQNVLDSQLSLYVTGGVSDPDSKITYTYNAYNHFNTLFVYHYNGTAYNTVPDASLELYYEIYNATTAISTVTSAANSAGIYPNPAKDVLNIRFRKAPDKSVTVRIFNTMGQIVQQATLNAAGSAQLPLINLAPGNYTAEILDGATTQHLPFVKY